jgi:hypothetical protein
VDRLLYELRHVNGDTHYFFACQYVYPAEVKDQLIHDLAAGFGERAISLTAEEW